MILGDDWREMVSDIARHVRRRDGIDVRGKMGRKCAGGRPSPTVASWSLQPERTDYAPNRVAVIARGKGLERSFGPAFRMRRHSAARIVANVRHGPLATLLAHQRRQTTITCLGTAVGQALSTAHDAYHASSSKLFSGSTWTV